MKTIEVKRNKDGQTICPKCGCNMWGVEYDYSSPERYDGVSEWFCNETVGGCGLRVGRWSKKILTGKMIEKRLGGK